MVIKVQLYTASRSGCRGLEVARLKLYRPELVRLSYKRLKSFLSWEIEFCN